MYKAIAVGIFAGAVTLGVGLAVSKGGPRAPDTFEIVTVEMSAGPEPSVQPSAPPVLPPAQAPGVVKSRIPASQWESPEASVAGVVGGRLIIVTPPAPKKG